MVKKLSRIFVVFLAVVFLLTSFNMPGIGLLEAWASNSKDTVIYYDGNRLEFTEPESIIKRDDIFLAPAAELASLTGMSADINNNSIIFTNDMLGLNVDAVIGSNTILVNGNERIVSTPPENIDGIVMFPVKDFFYTMNCSVKLEKSNSNIIVSSPLTPVYKSGNVVIHKAATSPILDGVDTDDAWNQAEENSGFLNVFYMKEPESDTTFKVTYDDDAIYLFVNCQSAPVPLEGVSVFIAPANVIGTDTPYYNAVLIPERDNTTVVYDGINRYGGLRIQYAGGSREYTLTEGTDFNAKYNVNDTSWTAEVKIPYEKLVASPASDVPVPSNAAEWRFNITRVRPFTETASSWVPIRNSIYGDNMIVNDCSYVVNFMYMPTTNRMGSIFFEEYPEISMFDNTPMPYLGITHQNAGLRYKGYDTKLVYFDKEVGIDVENARFCSEWVSQLGIRSKAEILNITEKDSRLYFTVKHPTMPCQTMVYIDLIFIFTLIAKSVNMKCCLTGSRLLTPALYTTALP